MLKIKNNVDFVQLKKYGFEITKTRILNFEDEIEEIKKAKKDISIILGDNYKVEATIVIDERMPIIEFGMVDSKFEYELYKKFVEETLFDLIQNGLVKKG